MLVLQQYRVETLAVVLREQMSIFEVIFRVRGVELLLMEQELRNFCCTSHRGMMTHGLIQIMSPRDSRNYPNYQYVRLRFTLRDL